MGQTSKAPATSGDMIDVNHSDLTARKRVSKRPLRVPLWITKPSGDDRTVCYVDVQISRCKEFAFGSPEFRSRRGYNSYVQWFSFRIYRRTQRLDISHHLGAQLPMLVRGIYYEGWRIAGKPTKDRHIDEFIGHVLKKLPPQFPVDALTVSRGVFEALWEKLDPGEFAKLMIHLPASLRTLRS